MNICSRPFAGLVTMAITLLAITTQVTAYEALPTTAISPTDNPTTIKKITLGKQLYFDPRLSVDGTISCNSCHNVMSSGTDNRPTSVGVNGQRGGRSAPTVWNSALLSVQFWDGRAATLEEQAKGPPLNPIEMGMPSEKAVVERLNSIPGYAEQFKTVFGGDSAVSFDNMAKAIAAFERTLITGNSPFDRYIKGDKNALSAQAKQGMKVFESMGCGACHSGANFAGPTSLPVGQGFYQKFPVYPSKYEKQYGLSDDKGRFQATKNSADAHMWRVPSLRNIALTAPYFHNGAVTTLEKAVQIMAKTQLNKEISTEDSRNLVVFLESLSGTFPDISMARLPETTQHSVVGSAK